MDLNEDIEYIGKIAEEKILQLQQRIAALEGALLLNQEEIVRLQAQEIHQNQIMDSMPAMIGYVNLNQQVVFANKQLENWYQLDRQTITGMYLKDLFSSEHYEKVKQLLDQVLSGDEVNQENEITYPDGVRRHVHLNYIPDTQGEDVMGYYFLVRDISKRKCAELQLKEHTELLDFRIKRATQELEYGNRELREEIQMRKYTEDKLRSSQESLHEALESMTDGFLLFDSEGQLVAHNSKIMNLFPSLTSVVAAGLTFRDILRISAEAGEVKEAIGRVEQWLDERMSSYPSNTGSVEVQLSDGRWILATDRLTSNNGVVGLRTEITDRKQAEEKIRLQNEQMASVLRRASMGEMASALAHEMSQPLAAITNYSRGTLRRLEPHKHAMPEVMEALQRSCQEAERAKSIINNISGFVRQTKPSVEDHKAEELVNAVVELSQASLHRNNIRCVCEMSGFAVVISVNRIEIEQVLFNLMRNSIDSLKTVESHDRKISIKVTYSSDRGCIFQLSDNAKGIDELVRDRLFEPYITSKDSGLGMGLSISRTIIESHGGKLWIEHSDNNGTTMSFNLPDARAMTL